MKGTGGLREATEKEGLSYGVFHVCFVRTALRLQQSTDSSLLLVDDEVTSQQVSVFRKCALLERERERERQRRFLRCRDVASANAYLPRDKGEKGGRRARNGERAADEEK